MHNTKYFTYLWKNWNYKIASHILPLEVAGEKKYGIRTTGADELRHLRKNGIDTSHATLYMPASYDILEDLFSRTTPSDYKHFIDFGCGKGRVICMAALLGFKKITGLELSPKFCLQAEKNIERIRPKIPNTKIAVVNNDAYYFEIPKDADCLFFFNPFDEFVLRKVMENIDESIRKNPREITLLYLNALNRNLFKDYGFTEIYNVEKLKYLQGAIYTNKKK